MGAKRAYNDGNVKARIFRCAQAASQPNLPMPALADFLVRAGSAWEKYGRESVSSAAARFCGREHIAFISSLIFGSMGVFYCLFSPYGLN